MSELEKIKADLAAVLKTIELLNINKLIVSSDLVKLSYRIEAKINELETPPDPWEKVRKNMYDETGYLNHLECEIERLKSELESRPVVWCIKEKDTNYYPCNMLGGIDLFDTKESAEWFIINKLNNPENYKSQVYMGYKNG